MNKKLLYGLMLPLLAVVLVAAAAYGSVDQSIDIQSPISVTSLTSTITAWLGQETITNGAEITIENVADIGAIEVEVSNTAEEGIEVSYLGELELTKKDISTWQPTTDKVTISYTVIGNEFEYSGVPEGYTLIYYKDAVIGLDGRLENPQPAIEITSEIGSLPQEDDANSNANYSEAPDHYEHETGAKLWAVPIDAVNSEDKTLDWSQMSEFYYETDLIEYVQGETGTLTIISETILTPKYAISSGTVGTISITTNVDSIA